ncbi:hypothetical protein ACEUZ9_004702 [Paracoccus litorisediminis]|uniref:hypothetical protein n=1 Tax=Paracoccus litorisediminis TaxID=2006130 RepID=UPI00372E6237
MRNTARYVIIGSASALAMFPLAALAQAPAPVPAPVAIDAPVDQQAILQPEPAPLTSPATVSLGAEPAVAAAVPPVAAAGAGVIDVMPISQTGNSEVEAIHPAQAATDPNAPRILTDEVDPMSAELVRNLDADNFVQTRIRNGLDVKMMEDELKRVQSIEKLVDAMGIDGFKAAFPDLYESMQHSPAMLSAQIRRQELMNDLKKAEAGPEEIKIAADATPAPPPVQGEAASFFGLGGGPASPEPLEPPPPVTPAEEIIPPEPEAVMDIPISLREVYGIDGRYYAIILHGEEKIRVTKGDILPGETEVRDIGDGYIDILRHGEDIRIRIQG